MIVVPEIPYSPAVSASISMPKDCIILTRESLRIVDIQSASILTCFLDFIRSTITLPMFPLVISSIKNKISWRVFYINIINLFSDNLEGKNNTSFSIFTG